MTAPLDYLLRKLTVYCILHNILLEAKKGRTVITLEKEKIAETCCRHDPDLCLDRELIWQDLQQLLPVLETYGLVQDVRTERDKVRLRLTLSLLRAAAHAGTARELAEKIRLFVDKTQAALVDLVYSVLRDYVQHGKNYIRGR